MAVSNRQACRFRLTNADPIAICSFCPGVHSESLNAGLSSVNSLKLRAKHSVATTRARLRKVRINALPNGLPWRRRVPSVLSKDEFMFRTQCIRCANFRNSANPYEIPCSGGTSSEGGERF